MPGQAPAVHVAAIPRKAGPVSKESKSRDRWQQLHAAAYERHPDYCKGCGYYHVVHLTHRADCIRNDPRNMVAP